MSARGALLLVVAALFTWEALPVTAEDVPEVIVTARKREESILKVPVAETAITGQQLTQFATGPQLQGVGDRSDQRMRAALTRFGYESEASQKRVS
jgi:hypothetical protein